MLCKSRWMLAASAAAVLALTLDQLQLTAFGQSVNDNLTAEAQPLRITQGATSDGLARTPRPTVTPTPQKQPLAAAARAARPQTTVEKAPQKRKARKWILITAAIVGGTATAIVLQRNTAAPPTITAGLPSIGQPQ